MSGVMSGKTSGKVLHLLRETLELSIPEMATLLGKSDCTIERETRDEIGGHVRGQWPYLARFSVLAIL
jgi:hypothetical protein